MTSDSYPIYEPAEVAPAKPEIDLSFVPEDDRENIQRLTVQFADQLKDGATRIFETGETLLNIKDTLEHGAWSTWLERFFPGSERMAQNMMAVAENLSRDRIGELPVVLPDRVLYLLAAPSTPEDARDEVLKKVEAGEKITLEAAQDIVADKKGKPRKERKSCNREIDVEDTTEPAGWQDEDPDGNPSPVRIVVEIPGFRKENPDTMSVDELWKRQQSIIKHKDWAIDETLRWQGEERVGAYIAALKKGMREVFAAWEPLIGKSQIALIVDELYPLK